jgi:hypothetical protein
MSDVTRTDACWQGQLLKDREPADVLCNVRKDGKECRIRVVCGDHEVVNWQGNAARLGLEPPALPPRADVLFVNAWTGSFRVSKLQLLPVSRQDR